MEKTSHVFVVGVPRSGTTLLRQVLNLSSEIKICPETHFFGSLNSKSFIRQSVKPKVSNDNGSKQGLRRKIAPFDWTEETGADDIVELMYGLDRAYSRWLKSHIDRDEMRAVLLATERTDWAFFDTMMALYAGDEAIRGEKTPAHLFYVPTLMDWFPQAKIIHIIRDPRAVYVSHKKKWKTNSERSKYHQMKRSDISLILYITAVWLQANRLHHIYTSEYPTHYYSCRFEDFTASPRNRLLEICSFLGIEFEDSMLQPELLNSGFIPKEKRIVGIDTTTSVRWREHIHPLTNLWFRIWTKKHLHKPL